MEQKIENKMSKMKNKYLEEYEKYKHVTIEPRQYELRSNKTIRYEVLSVDEEFEKVVIKTLSSGIERTRTLHWCRKNLEVI